MQGDRLMSTHTDQQVTLAHVAGIEARVTGLEGGLKNVLDAVNSLATKVDSRSATPWGVIASFGILGVAVLGGFGKLAYDPIKDTQVRQEILLEKVSERREAGDKDLRAMIVPRSEHELFWKGYDRSLERIVKRLDRLEYGDKKGS